MDTEHVALYNRLSSIGVEILDGTPRVPARIEGKGLSNLFDPAWETVSGAPPWQYAGSIFRPYTSSDCEKAYRANSIINACTRLLCDSLAEPPFVMSIQRAGESEEIEDNEILDLLAHPNRRDTRSDLTRYWASNLVLTGKGYLWKWRTKGGAVGELWPVPTSWVRAHPGKGGDIIGGYSITQHMMGKEDIAVKPEDMIAIRLVDPSTIIDGVGALQAAQHEYQLDMERQNYLIEMLTNLHIPGLKVVAPRKLSQKEKQEARQTIADRTGQGHRGGMLFAELGLDYEVMEPLKDMDWPGLTEQIECRICAVFGVPAMMLGLRAGAATRTYANYAEARRAFYNDRLRPLWNQLGDALTRGLCEEEGQPEYRVEYDLDDVPDLQEDQNVKAARVREDWKAKLITRDEARAQVGYDPAPVDGDQYFAGPEPTVFGAPGEGAPQRW